MARAEIQVTRHEAEYRWEANIEGRVLTGSVPVEGTKTQAARAWAQATAWQQAARSVSRLVSSFKGDS